MSGRIEVVRTLAPVVLSARVLNDMCEHARETHPEECCGLLVGATAGSFEAAHRCRNEMTRMNRLDPATHPHSGRTAFHMNEGDVQRVLDAAEAGGQLVTGVYHSHTDAGAYFSELDQEFVRRPGFPFPQAQHVVISVRDGVVGESAVFRRTPGEPGFEGRLLVGSVP